MKKIKAWAVIQKKDESIEIYFGRKPKIDEFETLVHIEIRELKTRKKEKRNEK